MSGTLFIVPTPVGNLADMTPRAVEVLSNVALILAEDTRTSAVLLQHFAIKTPMQSYHKFNEHQCSALLAQRILAGENIALISDAGTPGISDPGFLIARECRALNINVVTLPGPTAFVPALINSGLPCNYFVFEGFLPQKKGRETRLRLLADDPRTFILYESPLRLIKTLQQLAQFCGPERPASVSREISKVHEDTCRGSLAELIDHFTANNPRGECVIIVGGKPEPQKLPHTNKYRQNQPIQ